RGKENSFTYKKDGLLHRLLDRDGVPAGVPIKASTIAGKPTLARLAERFTLNKSERELPRLALQNTLDKILTKHPRTINVLINALEKENITTLLRQNEEGKIYGITFIDHHNHSVFNGSEIGKAYSILGLQKQLSNKSTEEPHLPNQTSLLEQLISPENELTYTPKEFLKKKKETKTITLKIQSLCQLEKTNKTCARYWT
ncbi:MAG: hypothetical protein Q8J87_08715, partial [Sediminibacterium sp.]|nr:hypothetical protein [Sediminibacterium sp.]